MAGPSAHGQRNKVHKAGRRAGASAREKHKLAKEGGAPRPSVKAAQGQGKAQRIAAAQQHREAKRQEVLERKRKATTPIVVALLALSGDVDTEQLFGALIAACDAAPSRGKGGSDDVVMAAAAPSGGLAPQTVSVQGRPKLRLTFVPPPQSREDLLAVAELGRSAEALLVAVPAAEGTAASDTEGERAIAVLRAMGLPHVVGVVQGGSGASMKERSAAKKRAEKALAAQVAGGEPRIFHADTADDCQQLIRHLAEHPMQPPLWRQQRASLMVEGASYQPETATLCLTGYVRYAGLSANGLVTIPGAGDFQIARITAAREPSGGRGAADMEQDGEPRILAAPSPDEEERETVVRENDVDPLDMEQTFPTEEELREAEAAFNTKLRKKRVPKGTSEYQAAWIPNDLSDGDDDDELTDEPERDGHDHYMAGGAAAGAADRGMDAYGGDDDLPDLEEMTGPGSDDEMQEGGEEDEAEEAKMRAVWERLKAQRTSEAEDAQYPDEIDTPTDQPARVRFQKYRGLKSFRTSPWDPKEGLPAEFGRVFAFENFKRAYKRAKEAVERATADLDPCSVSPGAYVTVHIANVTPAQAEAAVQRAAVGSSGAYPPLVAFGLMTHECKMSIVNFGIKKAPTYKDTIRNKEELLFVTGLRSFTARPLLSGDEHGADKFKMERYLHDGRHTMASVFAPISYPPLPALLFKVPADGGPAQLAASGALRSCNPDRVVLKKIVLTGYPVRVHKKRGVVRFMFHNPEDIRWFKPVEVWTKSGRRGRITESLGTHGAMKCLFDGNVQQNDSVCMALYKRVFPKWPADLTFA